MPGMAKRPRDPNQLAKTVIAIATGESRDKPSLGGKDPEAVALGSKGGKKGGAARAAKLSPKRRQEIAKLAATARWRDGK
jgi:hypothetical protein